MFQKFVKFFFTLFVTLSSSLTVFSQPPIPDPNFSPGGVQQINCGAPVGNGLYVVLALALTYGLYLVIKEKRTELGS